MEITLLGEHIYAGEHRSRTLHVVLEQAYADKTVKLAFITPAGKIYFSETLTLVNGETDYLLPCALLDAKGLLQAQLHVTDEGELCAKSRVYFFEVERSVDGGEAFDGDRLLSLADLIDGYTYLKNALTAKADKANAVLTGSVSLGRKTNTSSGTNSVAAGLDAAAAGNYAQSFGRETSAAGESAHAEGAVSVASGLAAHAEGYGSVSSGDYSHAEGYESVSSGAGSHAEGEGTVASGAAQHAEGKFNISDTLSRYAHIVGNGSADNDRSNAHTLDWNGNAWFAGQLRVGGSDYAAGAKVLTASDIQGKANTSDLAAVATSGAYADLSGTPDLSAYAQSTAVAADIAAAKQNVNDRLIVTAQYNFSTGVIGSFDPSPDNWDLTNGKKAFVLRLTDGTRTFDLTADAKTDLFVERRLLTGVIPMKTVLGYKNIIPDTPVQPFAFAACVLGFDDTQPSGSAYAYCAQRTDGVWVWIGKVHTYACGVLTDDTTLDTFRLGVNSGRLYIEEV